MTLPSIKLPIRNSSAPEESLPNQSTDRKIAVIGAGAAGLSASKHLLARGIDVAVFEAGSTVGGLWVYENDSGLSPAYDSLTINSPASATSYSDFPFPDGTSVFPDHRVVHSYLEAYADHFGVRDRIRFGTWVTAVEPVGARWIVTLDDGSSQEFDGVVVATGHQWAPVDPAVADDFEGTYLHARDYRTPEPFRGKRVLIVGVGNSGLDIAADVCSVTDRTVVAVRSPVLIMPRTLFGVPTSEVLAKVLKPYVPWVVQRTVREWVTRIVHGKMERFGLVTPKKRTHPASHPTFMTHVVYGRIDLRPAVDSVAGRVIYFVDGSQTEIDVMIGATGYRVEIPFLGSEVSPVADDQRSVHLYRRVVHPQYPGLYFVGYFDVGGGGNIRMMDVQASWVAAIVAGDVTLPAESAMEEDLRKEKHRIASRYPGTPRYGLELDPEPYKRAIARELKREA